MWIVQELLAGPSNSLVRLGIYVVVKWFALRDWTFCANSTAKRVCKVVCLESYKCGGKSGDVSNVRHLHGEIVFSVQLVFLRERERFTTSIRPAWLMRAGLCSCLSLLQQGNETMADRLLVLEPHEQMHAPRSILNMNTIPSS